MNRAQEILLESLGTYGITYGIMKDKPCKLKFDKNDNPNIGIASLYPSVVINVDGLKDENHRHAKVEEETMTYEDKLKLVDLARQMMTAPIGENGIDETMLQLIHPNAKSNKDYSGEELCIIMWVDGYLRCKKENRNIIENMMKVLDWKYPSKGELPDAEGDYFVAMKDATQSKEVYLLAYTNYKEKLGWYDEDGTNFDNEVYAWCKKPEPPEEEGK